MGSSCWQVPWCAVVTSNDHPVRADHYGGNSNASALGVLIPIFSAVPIRIQNIYISWWPPGPACMCSITQLVYIPLRHEFAIKTKTKFLRMLDMVSAWNHFLLLMPEFQGHLSICEKHSVCLDVCMYLRTYVYMFLNTYVCMYLYMFVCMLP